MGVLYSVIPLATDMAEWLDELGVSYPPNTAGRSATPRQIRMAISKLDGFVAEYNSGDDFTGVLIHSPDKPKGPWTQLNIQARDGLDDPVDFYFEKGWPEAIIPVVIRLSAFTGPLLLIADTGEAPVVVTPDKSVDSVMSEWETTTN